MKSTRELSVIVPCFNEAGNIPELCDRLLKVFEKLNISSELILVDDGSRDDTARIIREKELQFPNKIRGVFHATNRGIETAWKEGVRAATGNLVCIIDGDLQNLPEDIIRLYRDYTQSNVDLVQGWRSSIGRQKGTRYLLSIALNKILNVLFGMRSRDNKSGFILTRREVFLDVLQHRFSYFYFQSLITVAAHAKGYSIREVETLFDKRLVGQSFLRSFPLLVVAKALADIGKAFFEYRIRFNSITLLERFSDENNVLDKSVPWSTARKIYFYVYGLLMPIHHWMITREAIRYFWILRKTQWLPPEKIKKLQFKKLKILLDHSYRHVAYYHDLFEKLGITPDDITCLDDLRKLPFLDKQTVRENLYFDLFSDNHDKKNIYRISTSGSTGQPFICYADRTQLEIRWAATLRSQEWTGYRFGDRCLRLWHQTIGMNTSQIVREFIDAFMTRRKFIPAYRMKRENLPAIVRLIAQSKASLIDGYAESFNMLAQYVRDNPLTQIRPKGIISSAQSLPPQSRTTVEQVFMTKVFDKYGAREFSGIAYECNAHRGHHIMAEQYIVEIIKDGKPAKPGEVGEVVITDLNNFCMPFIRYRIGDLATATDEVCSCGRGLPLMGEIHGRTQAIIIGTRKQYVPGSFFLHLFKEFDYGIRQFQVEQREFGTIILRIIKGPRYTDDLLTEIFKILQDYLGPDLKIEVQFLEAFPLGRTGKFQPSLSSLNLDFQVIKDGLRHNP
ncbi:MAG: glycosyltransferase [Candidatus Paceibacterota bacterium]|jgi:phenylacetate-CoA ligase